ncbi:MAG: hypothetical protein JW940_09650, partial [Polyangiaceae bacterium]|nr:hypothetical protein [Polyangiaceae bacterium]
LLVGWSDGRREQVEIPPSGIVEVGSGSEAINAAVPLYGNGPTPVGKAVIRGPEIPSMIVAPAPIGALTAAGAHEAEELPA